MLLSTKLSSGPGRGLAEGTLNLSEVSARYHKSFQASSIFLANLSAAFEVFTCDSETKALVVQTVILHAGTGKDKRDVYPRTSYRSTCIYTAACSIQG